MSRSLTLLAIAFSLVFSWTSAVADDRKDCEQDGDPDLSIKACSAILAGGEEEPGNRAIAYTNRGVAYRSKGEYDRAITDYNRAIELNPKDAIAYNNRGNAYSDKGQIERAIADYNRAIELNPNYASAYSNRGIAYDNKGQIDQAIADHNRAIELNPNYAAAYKNRGSTYGGKGEYDQAIADYNRAIELNPHYTVAYTNRGNAYFNKGDFARASMDFLRATELKDDAYAVIFRYLARARLGENAASELDANASRLKTREWPYPVIEFYLGKRKADTTLTAAGKPDERCEAHFYIGEWLILQNEPANAADSLRKAAETCSKAFIEYTTAQAELKRLKP